MREHHFPYVQVSLPPDQNFPNGRTYFRPVVPSKISHAGITLDVYSLVDTGADFCAFPLQFGIALGLITPNDMHETEISCVKGERIPGHWRRVTLELEVTGKWEVDVVFTSTLDDMKGGLLGGFGFFDRYLVSFDLPARQFCISVP